MSVIDDVTAAIKPVIEAGGNYLEEATITNAGKLRILTVIVDSDSHLNLDQVTAVSRDISEIVEGLTALGETPFTLEVTSPGVDRPLTLPRHWRKNAGRLVKAGLLDGSTVEGRIGAATESTVQINDQVVEIAAIKKALIEIEFKSLKSEEGGDE
jgi:ribosome maturation factor RimP